MHSTHGHDSIDAAFSECIKCSGDKSFFVHR